MLGWFFLLLWLFLYEIDTKYPFKLDLIVILNR